jgi:hypothetical protein
MFRKPSMPIVVTKKGSRAGAASGAVSTGSTLQKRDAAQLATLLRELTVEQGSIREAMG